MQWKYNAVDFDLHKGVDQVHAMRKFGNMIQMRMQENQTTNEELAQALHLEEAEVRMLYKGRLYLSLEQLNSLSVFLNEDLESLMAGDEDYYDKKMVHCMTAFSDVQNREMILDFIDSYLDVYKAASVK